MTVLPPSRRWALVIGGLIAILGGLVLAAVFIFSGIYNVGASAGHFRITNLLLDLTVSRSVATHSLGVEAPELDPEGRVRLGALHFATGCEPCHAGPGIPRDPIIDGMYPSAPPLGRGVEDWDSEELFWIVRHGLKYTGMPQWPGGGRDDEVWAVVAFLEQLPGMSPQRYAELTGSADAEGLPAEEHDALAECAKCHGADDRGPVDGLVPALQGQNAAYLMRALEEYARDSRQSGMMESIAVALEPEEQARLARRYASMPLSSQAPDEEAEKGDAAAGREIATRGVEAQNVPPCLACHSGRGSAQFPRLDGLSEHYIANQLRLFRGGVRGNSAYGAIMAPIARRLTKQQVGEVAAYFARRARASPEAAADEGRTIR